MNGVLLVDKPPGPTSHDVVASVRRAIGFERIGHTGTLDPLATGLLALVVGRATRLASLLTGVDKEYVARVRFGATTATYDAEEIAGRERDGQPVLAGAPPRVPTLDASAIAKALPGFEGTYLQTPPPYSAKKIAGAPAYKLARRRTPVEMKPVEVSVREIELVGFGDGLAEVRLVSSSGFYVRSFAHDLGQRLGCGAYLEGLRRTRVGDFQLADAVTLDIIVGQGPAAANRLVPMDRLLTHLPAVVLTEQGVRRASHGSALTPADLEDVSSGLPDSGKANGGVRESALRLLDRTGGLVGIAKRIDGGLLHPSIVLV